MALEMRDNLATGSLFLLVPPYPQTLPSMEINQCQTKHHWRNPHHASGKEDLFLSLFFLGMNQFSTQHGYTTLAEKE
jgi:hypothetical protein